MEKTAYREVIMATNENFRDSLKGPIVLGENDFSIVYKWYMELPFSDTAFIRIEVPKKWNPFSRESVRTVMNYQWNYLEGSMSNIDEILPYDFSLSFDSIVMINDYYDETSGDAKTISYLVDKNRVLYDIEKGFFEIIKKTPDYSIISFYQPIAEIKESDKLEDIPTSSAIIRFNNSAFIILTPIPEMEARR